MIRIWLISPRKDLILLMAIIVLCAVTLLIAQCLKQSVGFCLHSVASVGLEVGQR